VIAFIKTIKVGEERTRNIDIPVVSIGHGSPRIGIICGIHGDETTSFLIASKLKELNLKKGSVDIFLGANRLALMLGKRGVHADLNRVFPGKKNGNMEERIAEKLVKVLKKMDLVIDLHCFELETPVLAIQFTKKNKFVELFNPEQVWVLNPKHNNENEFSTALGPWLTKSGINNFAVETDTIEHFSDTSRVLEGIKNILKHFRMIPGKAVAHKTKKFRRQETKANIAGIFVPNKKPLNSVKNGETVGEIISLDNLSRKKVSCEENGTLMQIRRQSQVKTGDLLFAVGDKNNLGVET
jgi:hypothetical protein